jgi:hypothetical protein
LDAIEDENIKKCSDMDSDTIIEKENIRTRTSCISTSN